MRQLIIIAALFCSIAVGAQEKKQFDPQRFEALLESQIIKKAELTQAEQDAFLPIFREMRKKQMEQMNADHKDRKRGEMSDAELAEAIKKHDKREVEIAKIKQDYHAKFLKVLSPKKVMKAIKAEDDFHRQAFSNMVKHDNKPSKKPGMRKADDMHRKGANKGRPQHHRH